MTKLSTADKHEVDCGRRWQRIARALNCTLYGWTGEHAAQFVEDHGDMTRIAGSFILNRLEDALARARGHSDCFGRLDCHPTTARPPRP